MPTDITLASSLHGLSLHNLSLDGLQATTGAYNGSSVRSLTPEAMLAYCQMNLKDIDDQVQKYMDHQKNSLQERKAFQSVTEFMQVSFDANGPKDAAQWKQCAAKVDELIRTLSPTDPRIPDLKQLSAKLGDGTAAANTDNMDHWKQMSTGLTKMTDDIKSGSELDMIQLQSLISQRQTAIQLTTGIISKLNESLQTIAQKIGG